MHQSAAEEFIPRTYLQ